MLQRITLSLSLCTRCREILSLYALQRIACFICASQINAFSIWTLQRDILSMQRWVQKFTSANCLKRQRWTFGKFFLSSVLVSDLAKKKQARKKKVWEESKCLKILPPRYIGEVRVAALLLREVAKKSIVVATTTHYCKPIIPDYILL